MSESLPLPPRDEQTDAKAWFYLQHRSDIETWAALRRDGAQLLERYLLALLPPLEDLATELDAEMYARDLESGAWPRLGLRRPTWQHQGTHDVAVVAEWDRGRLLGATRPWPYVGVRISPSQSDQGRKRAVADAVRNTRAVFAEPRLPSWPAWRYVSPPGTVRQVDPEALATGAWKALRELWALVAHDLDVLHESRTL